MQRRSTPAAPRPPIQTATPAAKSFTPGSRDQNLRHANDELISIAAVLKHKTVLYAKAARQQGAWNVDHLRTNNAQSISHIRSIADIEASSSTLTLLHCLKSVTATLNPIWSNAQSIAPKHIQDVIRARNHINHEPHRYADKRYADRAIQSIALLHAALSSAPNNLPHQAFRQPSTPSRVRHSPNPNQPPRNQPPSPTQTPTAKAEIDRWIKLVHKFIRKCPVFILSAIIFIFIIFGAPRFTSLEEQGTAIIVALVIAVIIQLAAKNKDIRRFASELPRLAMEHCTKISRIPDRKEQIAMWLVTAAVLITPVAAPVIYLATPPGYFGLTDSVSPQPPPDNDLQRIQPAPAQNLETIDGLQIQGDTPIASLVEHYASCLPVSTREINNQRMQVATDLASQTDARQLLETIIASECPSPSSQAVPIPTTTPVPAIPVSALSQPLLEPHGLTAEQINGMFQSGTLEPDQKYNLASCAINPAREPRQAYIFSQDDDYIDSPIFSILTADEISLDHHACYQIAATYVGPQLWRACDRRPYGLTCPRGHHDGLWEKDVPSFTATQDDFRPIHDP